MANQYADPAVVLQRATLTFDALGLNSADALDDLVSLLNDRASALIENLTQRDFIQHTDDVVEMDGNDLQILVLPGYPILAVSQILEDGVLMVTTDYRVRRGTPSDPDNAGVIEHRPPGVFREGWERFEVTYTWGYATVPPVIQSVAENLIVRVLISIKATKDAPGATSVGMDGFSITYDKDMLRTLLSEDDRMALARYQRIITG